MRQEPGSVSFKGSAPSDLLSEVRPHFLKAPLFSELMVISWGLSVQNMSL